MNIRASIRVVAVMAVSVLAACGPPLSGGPPPSNGPASPAMGKAQETSVLHAMRTISTGEIAFQNSCFYDGDQDGVGDYGTLAQLANPSGNGSVTPFIDEQLGAGEKSGYVFVVTVTVGSGSQQPAYSAIAVPADQNDTQSRRFYVDETGLIRGTADGSTPGPSSPAIQ